VDNVAGFVKVRRTDDTHEIVIAHPASHSDRDGLERIVLSPRHARHLANVLIEHATYAEAEAAGRLVESRPYRKRTS
jgi:hypothetical protein